MPKLREVTVGTKTKIYCCAAICQTCILAVLWTIKVGLTKIGNQAIRLKYSEEKYFIPI
jgi:hypothetical protein